MIISFVYIDMCACVCMYEWYNYNTYSYSENLSKNLKEWHTKIKKEIKEVQANDYLPSVSPIIMYDK